MKWEDMKESMGESWAYKFKDLIESDEWLKIFSELKSRKGRGIRTCPESKDVFKAFLLTPPENLKAIIVGYCPYHTFTKEGVCVADGIALSCGKTKILQPSLINWYREIDRTYNETMDMDTVEDPNLEFLSRQGILMYNVALTTMESKAGSDVELWSKFNKAFWEIINQYHRGLPIVFLGTVAAKSANLLTPMLHYPIITSHPASIAYSGADTWESGGFWKTIDKILEENYQTKVQWYMKVNEAAPWL